MALGRSLVDACLTAANGTKCQESPTLRTETAIRRMSRSRDIPDDADEKWEYTEHAAAKHEILHRYLGAWLAILGQGKRG